MSAATQIVAIDGPAGTGKSSVARALAKRLGFRFLDTGAMYRAATWRALHHGIDLEDRDALVDSTRAMQLELRDEGAGFRVFVDGTEVTDDIRTREVTRTIARLDQIPEVREHLVELQRAYGEAGPTVAEGRDMGTIVFPNASCKIFLDASPEVRAQRRVDQIHRAGGEADYDAILHEIMERDMATRKRKLAPLKRAKGAEFVDTTEMTFEAVLDRLAELAREKLCL
ncbi:MAG: (d)CMP kinase [Candidatus Hydrogenedens sp.]|nr:(d)CMP kinase [Candidatus Hydrogenedens sp.]